MTALAATSARFFLLDGVAGWRGGATSLAERPGDRAFVIDPVPGTAHPLFSDKASICPPPDPLHCPTVVAADPCAGLLAYDADGCAIVRIDAHTGGATTLAGVGGIRPGSSPLRHRAGAGAPRRRVVRRR